MASERLSLRETVTYSNAACRVDREAGVIHGVKLLGWESDNGRYYDPDAGKAALPMYEGASVRIDHRTKSAEPRKVFSVFGEARNCVVKPDGIYGDVHYIKSHEMAGPITEVAERMPRQLGMSHDAEGEGERRRDGKFWVKKITEVSSVDIVVDPATTKGFFEHTHMSKITVKALLESQAKRWAKARKGWLDRLLEMDGMDSPMAAEVDPPAEGVGADEALKSGFEAAIIAVFHDDALDDGAKAKKIAELVKTHGKLASSDDPEPVAEEDDSDDSKPKDAKESKDMQAKLDRLERKDACRELCESLGFQPTKDQLETLIEQATDKGRKAVAEAFKAAARGHNRPKSGGPAGLQESRGGKVNNAADLLEAITG